MSVPHSNKEIRQENITHRGILNECRVSILCKVAVRNTLTRAAAGQKFSSE